LADNGGPTATFALLPGSPAIDRADRNAFPPTDQRGRPRPSGAGPDIGAYEYTYVDVAAPEAVGGTIQFSLMGEVGNPCVVEVSSNLVDWVAISTNSVPSDGTVVISVPAADSGSHFYRAVRQ